VQLHSSENYEIALVDITKVPKGYPVCSEYGENIRRVSFGSYLIFYTIDEDTVVILHIVHGARNSDNIRSNFDWVSTVA